MPILIATPDNIRLAADALRRGELVGMPTETVYGLGCNALDEAAVRAVFAAKERPADNPLIVHIADMETLLQVAEALPADAAKLAAAFWPGPLTLVLPRNPALPLLVSGGLNTVAVRMPDHAVALSLIRAAGLPVAAPSANRFMRLSPTRAEDVEPELASIVLDGGDCRVGVESTVVDCTGPIPRILRPGGVTRSDLEVVLGHSLASPPESGERRSPGQYPRHYSPLTPLRLAEQIGEFEAGLTFGEPFHKLQIGMPRDPLGYAARLYAALHRLDKQDLAEIVVESPPEEPAWEAVNDRLRRASGDSG